jgi:hypothetical protein
MKPSWLMKKRTRTTWAQRVSVSTVGAVAEIALPAEDWPDPYTPILEQRTSQPTVVDQPRLLVAQLPGSGGSFLLQLFDGHPQCHTIPHEFTAGLGLHEKPILNRGAHHAWRSLHDERLAAHFANGFSQPSDHPGGERSRYPFLLPPSLQRAIFDALYAALPEPPSDRAVLDAYLTSYFNAWLDYQALHGEGKRWVVVLAPRFLEADAHAESFYSRHPDAHTLAVVRHPSAWFASARRWRGYKSRERAIACWLAAAERILRLKRELGERLHVVSFDDLVLDTPGTMRALSERVELEFTDDLLAPTFNRLPISAEPVEREREALTRAEQWRIRRRTTAVYAELRAISVPAARA